MPPTIAQLEAFVSSTAYDPQTAGLIALAIPALPAYKGEQISPGITRIHGNLCNVHGRYGPCDAALSGKKKPKGRKRAARKPRTPSKTPEQRQQERDATHAANTERVLSSLNIAPDGQQALAALRSGAQPDPQAIARGGFEQAGLVERAQDGSYRMTSSGRAVLAAAAQGDVGRAGDSISGARDRMGARDARQQASTARHAAAQQRRDQATARRAAAAKKRKKKAARRATKSFRVFKDARGRDRWVAQSSTAYQDRDHEIVSTKALADDCAFADATGSYGPLRWWHVPGLDLGDCDFNAMHGRVLIESGTFRSPQIAQKVAAADLEISLGFLHLPSEPDASGVFHHIRRFERSLVPRGKASNRFTAFRVKEPLMLDETKKAALKTLGFTDDDIAGLQAQAAATEKAADAQQIAFKAGEPLDLPDIVINGMTYKAFPPQAAGAPAEGSPEEEAAESPEEEAAEPDAQDAGGLTLSPEDLSAIGQAVADALAPLVGAMDVTNKIGAHMSDLKTMMGGYQTKKDAESAETKEQIAALQTQVAELTGDAPAAPYRASAAKDTTLAADAQLLAAVKAATDPNADPWLDIKQGLGLARQ